MLEIVFDENTSCEFLGQKCLEVTPVFPEDSCFSSYRRLAKKIVDENQAQSFLIIRPTEEGEPMNLLALALSIETYHEQTNLENVVFKVSDCKKAIEDYKPFMALVNSVRYARDLLRFDAKERWADIKRLGYLGLKVREDYINNQLDVYWPGEEPATELAAENETSGLVLIGILKALAICKEKRAVHGIIGGEENFAPEKNSEPENEDEMIEQIVEYVRMRNYGN